MNVWPWRKCQQQFRSEIRSYFIIFFFLQLTVYSTREIIILPLLLLLLSLLSLLLFKYIIVFSLFVMLQVTFKTTLLKTKLYSNAVPSNHTITGIFNVCMALQEEKKGYSLLFFNFFSPTNIVSYFCLAFAIPLGVSNVKM